MIRHALRPDGRLALFSQGQGVFDDRRQVARFLGVPEDAVTSVGGAPAPVQAVPGAPPGAAATA